ncbi:DNA repair protein (Rad57), putative [Talaromyces stipitatus ATCC 10500]|uniref:DNA repair protein (Rad57), putative n=1 Tax=Talaromyces stipitatus (strain ATCC 10500 / CBS 375.48 / QM 6759 / NRRL 1006) TaxID=441959 RepID=B8M2H3_TALSN|nr:DNA repair protein (Rad57), putative [Talaromyces stipitatus ATCC 10500]EED21637.1 DNA repair protein (Rad57), putative [Talaromyces stipitatus ATCC 10500]
MDLLTILPNFNTKPYTHILPPLERRHITTVDLITLDYLEIAKRAHVPPADVRRLCADVVIGLHGDLGFGIGSAKGSNNDGDDDKLGEGQVDGGNNRLDLSRWNTISTLDTALDELLGGGIATGYLTEITGESGSGKTQFLLNLLLTAQLPSPKGLGRKAIYISTEAPLSTPRLSQILQSHPYLSKLPANETPSLANVLSITAIDLETQDHILNYQLPVAISRYNVGLVVIDSIAANYRAEHASNSMQGLSARSGELAKLGHMLRNLAVREDVAIVVANQVSDRFDMMVDVPQQPLQHHGRFPRSSQTPLVNRHTKLAMMEANDQTPSSSPGLLSSSLPSSPSPSSQLPPEDEAFDGAYIVGHPVRNETLSLSLQQKFFTGWGDGSEVNESQKTPALGFVWSTQIACRIALKKEDEIDLSRVAVPIQASQPPKNGSELTKPEIKTARDVSLQSSPPQPSISSQTEIIKNESPPTTTVSTVTPTTIERITKRRVKFVFAPWTSGVIPSDKSTRNDNELEFEIWKGGLRSIPKTG